ncbi:glycosyltransferase [Phenylobacterium sp.]|uniref:glycosyltransferase n=1 Tax=Phenylobacterium sp. TaxID=1871053 RepID=UPI00356AA106
MTRLALVMIARDEASSIGRALESARGHVDRMIVLDTGSLDDTAAIARACGAEVHEFAWCDDFAAARNAALAHSDAAWNLVLDADEWIEGGAEALGPETLPAAAAGFLGEVRIGSRMDAGGVEGIGSVWIARLLPGAVRYAGRIHEQPVSDLPRRRLPLDIGHDGYTAENLARKGARNETLLMRELEAAPHDPYLWFQLGKEHQARGRGPQAAVCFTEALRLAPADVGWRHALVVRTLIALKADGRLAEALEFADAEVANWLSSPDFYFVIGDLYLEAAAQEPDRALNDFLPVVESAWKRCLEIGERPDLDGSVIGRGSYMAAHNLAVFYGTLGLAAQAAEYEAMAARLRR